MGKSLKIKLMLLCTGFLIIAFCTVMIRFGAKQIFINQLHQQNIVTKVLLGDNPKLLIPKSTANANVINLRNS